MIFFMLSNWYQCAFKLRNVLHVNQTVLTFTGNNVHFCTCQIWARLSTKWWQWQAMWPMLVLMPTFSSQSSASTEIQAGVSCNRSSATALRRARQTSLSLTQWISVCSPDGSTPFIFAKLQKAIVVSISFEHELFLVLKHWEWCLACDCRWTEEGSNQTWRLRNWIQLASGSRRD